MHCEQRDAAVDTENKGQPRLPFCILFNNDSMNHLCERDCDEDGRHHVHHAHFGGAGKVQPEADKQDGTYGRKFRSGGRRHHGRKKARKQRDCALIHENAYCGKRNADAIG